MGGLGSSFDADFVAYVTLPKLAKIRGAGPLPDGPISPDLVVGLVDDELPRDRPAGYVDNPALWSMMEHHWRLVKGQNASRQGFKQDNRGWLTADVRSYGAQVGSDDLPKASPWWGMSPLGKGVGFWDGERASVACIAGYYFCLGEEVYERLRPSMVVDTAGGMRKLPTPAHPKLNHSVLSVTPAEVFGTTQEEWNNFDVFWRVHKRLFQTTFHDLQTGAHAQLTLPAPTPFQQLLLQPQPATTSSALSSTPASSASKRKASSQLPPNTSEDEERKRLKAARLMAKARRVAALEDPPVRPSPDTIEWIEAAQRTLARRKASFVHQQSVTTRSFTGSRLQSES